MIELDRPGDAVSGAGDQQNSVSMPYGRENHSRPEGFTVVLCKRQDKSDACPVMDTGVKQRSHLRDAGCKLIS